MNKSKPIIIVGAGACGLMAARELAKGGKEIVILEARDRVGGRILPLPQNAFKYPAQGGAEFVHGSAPVTRQVMQEAGLTYVPKDGYVWNYNDNQIIQGGRATPHLNEFLDTLKELKEDMTISSFFDKYFSDDNYSVLRNSIFTRVKNYYAGDPERTSTFAVLNDLLSDEEIEGRIKEGYGAVLDFLVNECVEKKVRIHLNSEVKAIDMKNNDISIACQDGNTCLAEKVIITVPLPLLYSINFNPQIPEKLAATSQIGFGGAIKIIISFKERWWVNGHSPDLKSMNYLVSNEAISVMWTQYPNETAILTCWLGGTHADKYKDLTENEILEIAYTSLTTMFKVNTSTLKKLTLQSKVMNWYNDPFSKGAYSYPTVETERAIAELKKPVDNRLFFAGEAITNDKVMGTVEAALMSGQETARIILQS